MRVFNTLGRELQEFEPVQSGRIGIYLCGPTVQSEPHLGHGRSAVVFDVIRRYLVWRGFDVTFIRNVTDIEDKIIAAAEAEGRSVGELAALNAERFAVGYRALGCLDPDIEPAATDHIAEIIDIIGILVDADLAYAAAGDVYFRVRELPDYGKLSGRRIDELQSGARVLPGEQKSDPLDFALWKGAKDGEPAWDSPWGPGRPGWHIECSAMAAKYLGRPFDIHAGGTDLIFPHHENEIAQSEGAFGVGSFARYWMHNGMLQLSGEKMAKSTGLLVTLEDGVARYPAAAIRLFFLGARYRNPLDYTEELLGEATTSLERLRAFRRRAGDVEAIAETAAMEAFTIAMDDDFNTPVVMADLFDLVREANRRMDAGESAELLVAAFDEITAVLGIDAMAEEGTFVSRPVVHEGEVQIEDSVSALRALARQAGVPADVTPEEIIAGLLERRMTLRSERDFAAADAVRDGLSQLGVVLEDKPDGTTAWHRS